MSQIQNDFLSPSSPDSVPKTVAGAVDTRPQRSRDGCLTCRSRKVKVCNRHITLPLQQFWLLTHGYKVRRATSNMRQMSYQVARGSYFNPEFGLC